MVRRKESRNVRSDKRPEFLFGAEKVLAGSIFSLLILHEMDAVCWKEWRLFGIGDDSIGRMIFIPVHIPVLLFLFIVHSSCRRRWANIFCRGLAIFLIVHFMLHVWAFSEGYFTDMFSFGLISAMVPASAAFLSVSFLRTRSSLG